MQIAFDINPLFAIYGGIVGLAVAGLITAGVRSLGFGALSGSTFYDDFKRPALPFVCGGAVVGLAVSAIF